MDDYDRENLFFLLNSDTETLKHWYANVSEDDHQYASELLAAYGEELALKAILIDDSLISDLSDSCAILSQYTLGNRH